jgi:hypothetical protein
MFKASNVADSLWQMNLFMTLQVYRNLSNLSYMAVTHSPESEPEDWQDEAEEPRIAALDRQSAA